ncbi:hypothetical protein B0H67DRAFT_340411 [Lasiosphaeris hirsuta]|uniref:Uncharacterized protein n=1 Tax=Lasiosphaeris hirsuta TaxID=260670 RepID=A0AA40A336_9PEZI|nr:hypothetical protein B0H67DRAFT_340411 [Lasiosphaeris hirsuta]
MSTEQRLPGLPKKCPEKNAKHQAVAKAQSDRVALQFLLLSESLPADLPTADKDVLILIAAFNGDIDRYARLRRPWLIDKSIKINLCVRDIYHNTFFAQWWLRRQAEGLGNISETDWSLIKKAIHARFIMNNSLSSIMTPTCCSSVPLPGSYPLGLCEMAVEEGKVGGRRFIGWYTCMSCGQVLGNMSQNGITTGNLEGCSMVCGLIGVNSKISAR